MANDAKEPIVIPAYRTYGYNITPEEYGTMFQAQGGRCAICGQTPERTLHIDHDHHTNKVRGLLCMRCNTAIGLLFHDPKILAHALVYLEDAL